MLKEAKRKRWGVVWLFMFLLASLPLTAGLYAPVWAVPKLQIYIPGATYDTDTETWIMESLEYDLWVIGAQEEIFDVKIALAVSTDEDGTIDITWVDGTSSEPSYNSTGVATRIAGNHDLLREGTGDVYLDENYKFVSYGTPVMGDGTSVPPHGVFPTSYYEYMVGDFGLGETVMNFIPGEEWGDTAVGETKVFHVNVGEGYTWMDIVAYDHIVKTNHKIHSVFSPFSHDGGSGDGGQPPSEVIPEPASLLLVGTGLIGAGAVGRWRRKR